MKTTRGAGDQTEIMCLAVLQYHSRTLDVFQRWVGAAGLFFDRGNRGGSRSVRNAIRKKLLLPPKRWRVFYTARFKGGGEKEGGGGTCFL